MRNDAVISGQPILFFEPAPPLSAGQSFLVCVQIKEFQLPEEKKDLLPLEVGLSVSSHFVVEDDKIKTLQIPDGGGDSEVVRFELKVKKRLKRSFGPAIRALFWYNHRPSGEVRATLEIR